MEIIRLGVQQELIKMVKTGATLGRLTLVNYLMDIPALKEATSLTMEKLGSLGNLTNREALPFPSRI